MPFSDLFSPTRVTRMFFLNFSSKFQGPGIEFRIRNPTILENYFALFLHLNHPFFVFFWNLSKYSLASCKRSLRRETLTASLLFLTLIRALRNALSFLLKRQSSIYLPFSFKFIYFFPFSRIVPSWFSNFNNFPLFLIYQEL